MIPIILASQSFIRAKILRAAGIGFDIVPADLDETELIERGMARGLDLESLALELARAKAAQISSTHDGLVIAADQILGFEGKAFEKPKTIEEAKERLLRMGGKCHHLHGGTVIARQGKIIAEETQSASLYLRLLTAKELDDYFAAVGDKVLSSVGAYYIEEQGIRLFDDIRGDHFAILGLPILFVQRILREQGALSW